MLRSLLSIIETLVTKQECSTEVKPYFEFNIALPNIEQRSESKHQESNQFHRQIMQHLLY